MGSQAQEPGEALLYPGVGGCLSREGLMLAVTREQKRKLKFPDFFKKPRVIPLVFSPVSRSPKEKRDFSFLLQQTKKKKPYKT